MLKGKNHHQCVFILFSIPFLMIILWYFGRTDFFNSELKNTFPQTSLSPLYPFFYFSLSSLFLRTVLPILFITLIFKRSIFDFGYHPFGTFKSAYWYLIIFFAVLPLIFFASFFESFQQKYPFCNEIIKNGKIELNYFLIYQFFYFLIFLSGESFWRGYVLFGLERVMGMYAIPVMVIPYAMSHFGKPSLEAFSAIFAGVVLGYLALQHRNFYLGVLVHWGAAIFMDIVAMWQRGIVLI